MKRWKGLWCRERVHSGGGLSMDGESERVRERRQGGMEQTDGLTDAGSPTNGLSANC